MTNEQTAQELEYICGSVEFHSPQIKQFISSMDLPSLVACLGYIGGIIEAQLPDLTEAVGSIVATTREIIYPRMVENDSEPLRAGEVRMYYPVGAKPDRQFGTGSKLVQ